MSEEVQQQKEDGTIKIPKKTLFLVVGLIIVFFIGFSAGRLTGPTGGAIIAGNNAGSPPSGGGGSISVSVDDDPILGDPNAPINIIEFSDFECPFCGRFYSQTLPQLKTEYLDTGQAKLIYRDFPLSQIHPKAQFAGEAAECADDQGKFVEFHDLLFENQQQWISGDVETVFASFGQQIGLDGGEFSSCLDSGKHKSEVQKDLQDGIAAGVSGTPTFFIGNDEVGYQKLVGAQPFSAFQAAINAIQ